MYRKIVILGKRLLSFAILIRILNHDNQKSVLIFKYRFYPFRGNLNEMLFGFVIELLSSGLWNFDRVPNCTFYWDFKVKILSNSAVSGFANSDYCKAVLHEICN